MELWKSRLEPVQTSVQTHEPIIYSRLSLLKTREKVNNEDLSTLVAESRLQMARTAMECGQTEIAQTWLIGETSTKLR